MLNQNSNVSSSVDELVQRVLVAVDLGGAVGDLIGERGCGRG